MIKPRQISDFTKEQIVLGLEKFDIIVDEEQSKKILLANLYDTDLDGECDKYKRILLKDHLNELFPLDPDLPICPSCGSPLEKFSKVGDVVSWHCPDCPIVQLLDKNNKPF